MMRSICYPVVLIVLLVMIFFYCSNFESAYVYAVLNIEENKSGTTEADTLLSASSLLCLLSIFYWASSLLLLFCSPFFRDIFALLA